MRIIALTGGIGSGKSTVARVLRLMGYQVYDCDSRAKLIMDSNPQVKAELIAAFGPGVVAADGSIARAELAKTVFANADSLARLNSIVHPLVRADFAGWTKSQGGDKALFVETAILQESGMESMVDEVWLVRAPAGLRLSRVIGRGGLTEEQAKARMASQRDEPRRPRAVIINDGVEALLPQIMSKLG